MICRGMRCLDILKYWFNEILINAKEIGLPM